MIIRKMTISDYKYIIELWRNTNGLKITECDDSEEGLKKYLNRNPNTCFVAIENEHIIGTILSGHDGRRGYIYHTAVAGNMQKRGIGTQLLNTAIDALKNEGINKVALVALENNIKENAWWESKDFSKRKDLVYRNKNI